MDNARNMTDEEVRRLSWRCRRGLLELDIILQRFSEHHVADLSAQELSAFNDLLDLPDNEFLDVITARIKVESSAFVGRASARHDGLKPDLVVMQAVLEKLRQH